MAFRALVIDDDQASRLFIKFTLETVGFDVTEADNGAAALALLAEHPPALVVLDLLLPQVSGIEVLHHIYGSPTFANTRVIVLTAHEQYPEALRPTDQYFLKPVSATQLREAALQAVRDLP